MVLVTIAAVAFGAAGCGPVDAVTGGSGLGPWRELAGSPLAPREQALGLWTGTEALIIGGSDGPVCPANADCPLDDTPRRDGAAVDPATGRWRRIADAPVPILAAQGVVAGGTAYVLSTWKRDGTHPELLAYDIGRDAWRRLPLPFAPGDAALGLVATGDAGVVVYRGSHETAPGAPGPDHRFDAAAGTWHALPPDPLGRSFDRTAAWSGTELVLFGQELVANPGAQKPSLVRAAVFNPTARTWRRLPDGPLLFSQPWLATGGVLVNPSLGEADGGEVGNWGRSYPYGGVLDPATGRWSALPAAPPGMTQSAGVLGDRSARYLDWQGAVLDAPGRRWLSVPDPPGGDLAGRTVVAAGTDMLLFGGGQPREGGALVDDAWIWSPRS